MDQCSDLAFYLRGKPILAGCELPYRVFSLFGLTNPEVFALDIYNTANYAMVLPGVEIGLILPPELSARPSPNAVHLPDGRTMMLSEQIGRAHV